MPVDITKTVASLLSGITAITDLAESISGDRIPQADIKRGIVLWSLYEVTQDDLQGFGGLDQATFQIDAYGRTRSEANELAGTIRDQLDPKALTWPLVVDGVFIDAINRQSGIRSETDRVLLGTGQYRFIATQDLQFTYHSLELVT